MAAANHVQHRLALFFFDDFERALERRQNLLRIVDHLAVTTMRGDDHLVARRRSELVSGKFPVLTAQPSGMTCCVAALVECQIALLQTIVSIRQIVRLRNEMAGGRVVEHVSPVATAGDYGFLRMSELHTHTAADTPAQATGRRAAESNLPARSS